MAHVSTLVSNSEWIDLSIPNYTERDTMHNFNIRRESPSTNFNVSRDPDYLQELKMLDFSLCTIASKWNTNTHETW